LSLAGILILGAGVLLWPWSRPQAALAASDDKPAKDKDADDTKPTIQLEKVKEIVLWNEHNGKHHDSGTQTCNLTLTLEGKTVWERKDVEIPWEENKSANRVIQVPSKKADSLKVEITAWHEKGGGLSEIEVLDKTGTNLGFRGLVKTSADRKAAQGGSTLIDGIYDSPTEETGYWLLPEGQEGWAEITLMPQQIPPPPYEPPQGKVGKKKLSRTPLPADIYISCDNSFDLYVNGQHVLSGHGRRVFERSFSIANADIITVRCNGSSDTQGGFCFLAKFHNGHFLSTMSGWQAYEPADSLFWYAPERAKGATPPVKGTSGWAEKEMKEESGGKPPQIWGAGKTCYLVLVADTKVKHIKMKPGQQRKK
jgi:hypothetical protein